MIKKTPVKSNSFFANFKRVKNSNRLDKISNQLMSRKIPFGGYILTAVITELIVIILILFLKNLIPPEVPLMYGRPEGEEQLVPSVWLIIPHFFSIGVIFINCLIAYMTSDEFIKRILVLFSLLITLFSIITTFKIILLVGNV